MNTRQKFLVKTAIVIGIFLIPDYMFGRRGFRFRYHYSSNHNHDIPLGMSLLLLILTIIGMIVIYYTILTIKLYIKNSEVKILTKKISEHDPLWEYKNMKASVKEVFFRVKEAWYERNQDLAKDYMSERIYKKHKQQTDKMISRNKKNVLEHIKLINTVIFNASDYKKNSRDTFSVRIKGFIMDYTIDETTNKVILSDAFSPRVFTEVWLFIRVDDKWVVNEIKKGLGIWSMDLVNLSQAYTQGD